MSERGSMPPSLVINSPSSYGVSNVTSLPDITSPFKFAGNHGFSPMDLSKATSIDRNNFANKSEIFPAATKSIKKSLLSESGIAPIYKHSDKNESFSSYNKLISEGSSSVHEFVLPKIKIQRRQKMPLDSSLLKDDIYKGGKPQENSKEDYQLGEIIEKMHQKNSKSMGNMLQDWLLNTNQQLSYQQIKQQSQLQKPFQQINQTDQAIPGIATPTNITKTIFSNPIFASEQSPQHHSNSSIKLNTVSSQKNLSEYVSDKPPAASSMFKSPSIFSKKKLRENTSIYLSADAAEPVQIKNDLPQESNQPVKTEQNQEIKKSNKSLSNHLKSQFPLSLSNSKQNISSPIPQQILNLSHCDDNNNPETNHSSNTTPVNSISRNSKQKWYPFSSSENGKSQQSLTLQNKSNILTSILKVNEGMPVIDPRNRVQQQRNFIQELLKKTVQVEFSTNSSSSISQIVNQEKNKQRKSSLLPADIAPKQTNSENVKDFQGSVEGQRRDSSKISMPSPASKNFTSFNKQLQQQDSSLLQMQQQLLKKKEEKQPKITSTTDSFSLPHPKEIISEALPKATPSQQQIQKSPQQQQQVSLRSVHRHSKQLSEPIVALESKFTQEQQAPSKQHQDKDTKPKGTKLLKKVEYQEIFNGMTLAQAWKLDEDEQVSNPTFSTPQKKNIDQQKEHFYHYCFVPGAPVPSKGILKHRSSEPFVGGQKIASEQQQPQESGKYQQKSESVIPTDVQIKKEDQDAAIKLSENIQKRDQKGQIEGNKIVRKSLRIQGQIANPQRKCVNFQEILKVVNLHKGTEVLERLNRPIARAVYS